MNRPILPLTVITDIDIFICDNGVAKYHAQSILWDVSAPASGWTAVSDKLYLETNKDNMQEKVYKLKE